MLGEERARSVELGRRLFEKQARRFGLNPKTVLDSAELIAFAADYGSSNVEELLAHIGYGKLSARTGAAEVRPCWPPEGKTARVGVSYRQSNECCDQVLVRTGSRFAGPTM